MNSPDTNMKSPRRATGTLTARVNGIDNFNAEVVFLSADDLFIYISGVQDNKNSLIRAVEFKLVADVKNGTYTFNVDPEIGQLFLTGSSSQWYYTDTGTVTVDFDRDADQYRGSFTVKAHELPNGAEIDVIGTFDLEGLVLATVSTETHR